MDLRPPMLDDLGLHAAIEWLTRDFERRSGIQVTLRLVDSPEPIQQNIATAVYRIVQEALTNMARHARASQAVISMETRGRRLQLVVEDDGQGFPKDPSTSATGLFWVDRHARARAHAGRPDHAEKRSLGWRPAGGAPAAAAQWRT